MQRYNGMYLIEVVISFFILSIMLLGFDAALIFSLQHTKAMYYVSVADNQLNNLVERITAAKSLSLSESFQSWNEQNHDVLPQGVGTWYENSSDKIISIFWGKRSKAFCKTNQMGQSGCLGIKL